MTAPAVDLAYNGVVLIYDTTTFDIVGTVDELVRTRPDSSTGEVNFWAVESDPSDDFTSFVTPGSGRAAGYWPQLLRHPQNWEVEVTSGRITAIVHKTSGLRRTLDDVYDELAERPEGTTNEDIHDVTGGGTVDLGETDTTGEMNPIIRDTFDRPARVGTWGTMERGGTWREKASGHYDTDGLHGIVKFTEADETSINIAKFASARDMDLRVTLWSDTVPAGATTRARILVRVSSDQETRYELRVSFEPVDQGGSVQLLPLRRAAGTQTAMSATVNTALIFAVNQRYRVRMQVTGTTTVTFKARIWEDGSPEPATWDVNVTDASPTTLLQGFGGIGLGAEITSAYTGALPFRMYYDDLSVDALAT